MSTAQDSLSGGKPVAKTYKGGCACGAVRYEAAGEPIFQNHCQCRDCQQRSGTGHSSYLVFADRGEVDISGEVNTWRVAGDSGNDKAHAFCPTCGTPVYLTFAAMPDLVAIHAASLDDPSRFQPQAVTYGVCALDWDVMDAALAKFERMPG